jgi:hypothetical protein
MRVATVAAPFDYRHYADDRFDDVGWGCGYRSCQTILSWYPQFRGTSGAGAGAARTVPSVREIQQELVAAGDKPARFVGSRDWIGGAFEISLVLDRLCDGAQTRLLHVASGREVPALLPRLADHFEAHGAPAMIGGGSDVYSKTFLGVALPGELAGGTGRKELNSRADGRQVHSGGGDSGRAGAAGLAGSDERGYLLIADPHFARHAGESAADARARAFAEGWFGWKAVGSLSAVSFYNFALPQPSPAADGDAWGQGRPVSVGNESQGAGVVRAAREEDFVIELVERGHG